MNTQSLKLATLRLVMEFGNSLDRANPEDKAERLYQFIKKEDKPSEAPRKPGRPKKIVGSE